MRLHPLFAALAATLALFGVAGLSAALAGAGGWFLCCIGFGGSLVAISIGRRLR